jgi:endonuclease YncB( thermonuclease family)
MGSAFGFMASTRRKAVRHALTYRPKNGAALNSLALALQDLIGRHIVTCAERDPDRCGRTVARCFVGGLDVNDWLVAQDSALAYRRYSQDYVAVEDKAWAAARGMWAGSFEPPWEWRRRQ